MSLLILGGCGDASVSRPYVEPALEAQGEPTPQAQQVTVSLIKERNPVWVMRVYQAESLVLTGLMSYLRDRELDLSAKRLTTRYDGQNRWIVQVTLPGEVARFPDGYLGSWRVNPAEGDVEPLDDVAKNIRSRRPGGAGRLELRHIPEQITIRIDGADDSAIQPLQYWKDLGIYMTTPVEEGK